MLFEKIDNVKFRRYTSDVKEVTRHIDLKTELAEEVNKAIAVANKDNKGIKLNNTILFNLAIKKYLRELEELSEEEAIAVLRKGALSELGI